MPGPLRRCRADLQNTHRVRLRHPPSTYYAHKQLQENPSARQLRDTDLKTLIKEIFDADYRDGGVGYWNRRNASPVADPCREVIGQHRRVGSFGSAGDSLVVLQLVDDHRYSPSDSALDDANVVEMAGETDACLVEVRLDLRGDRPGGCHPVLGVGGLVIPKSEFADPTVACCRSVRVPSEVADHSQIVLEPEGMVPASFCLVGGVRDAASKPIFGVVTNGRDGLSRVVVLVVDPTYRRAARG